MSRRRNKMAAVVAELLGKSVVTHEEVDAYYAGTLKPPSDDDALEVEKEDEVEKPADDKELKSEDDALEEKANLDETIEEIEEEQEESSEDDELRTELEELTVDVLKDMLREQDLKVTGRKNQLIERLIRGEDEDDGEE